MARGPTKSLYLQVDGDIRGLKAATQAGKTVLNDFGGTAINVLEEVEREMAKVGGKGLPNLKTVEAAYTATFKRIGDSARAVLDAPTPQAAVQIIDAGAARQAADNATSQAAALRLVAEAATRADLATGGTDKATRAFAASAATAAVQAEAEAKALRDQATVLGTVERQLGVNAGAMKQATVVNGQSRAGYQQLSFQLGDVATQYAAGTSASIIFAQQSGQVIQAISLISGEAKGFIGFLGGFWGIALSSAAVVLTPWVAKLLEGGDALKKETDRLRENAEKSAIADRAKAAFSKTEAGLIEDVRELTSELDKQNEALKTNAERLNIRAKNRLENLNVTRDEVSDELAKAQTDVGAAQISENSGASGAVAAALAKIATIKTRLAAIDKAIVDAETARQRTMADLAEQAATRANDPVARIKNDYDGPNGLITLAKARAVAEGKVTSELTRQITTLQRQRDAKIKAEQDRQKPASTRERQFGREVTVSEARSIVGSIGGRVTSDVRSTERQAEIYAEKLAGRHNGPVAKPGTSAHEPGGAYDAIDVAYGKGISVASIKEAFAKEGVKLRKVLNEPGQRVFHVEFARAGRTGEQQSRAAESKAEAEADRRTRNADEYASLEGRARNEALQASRSRATTLSELADLDVAAIEAARDDLIRMADKGVALDKWTKAEADAVKLSVGITAGLEIEDRRQREKLQLGQRQFEIEQADLADKISMLRLQEGLTGTAEERRSIARQMLEIEQRMVRDALNAQIAAEKDPGRRSQLERRREQLPAREDFERQSLERSQQDPLQAYGQRLIDATSDMDEAFKGVAARGLASLEDGLVGVITGTESVADAFQNMANQIIADLARIAVQKLIVNAIGKSIFGGTYADGGLPGYDDIDGFADGGLPGYAGGGVPFVDRGLIRGPGTGRSDSILAMVGGRKPIRISNGEGIVNERAVQRYWPLIDAMNKGSFPKFADGGLVAPTSFVPQIPSIEGARRQLQAANDRAAPIRIVLGVTRGEAFEAEVLSVSGPATVQILRQSLPAITEAASAATISRLNRPGI